MRVTCDSNSCEDDGTRDDEASLGILVDTEDSIDNAIPFERRPALPPSYEQSGEGSHSDTLTGSDIEAAILDNNKPNDS